MTLVERVARAIADQIGPTYDEAYENKVDWIDERGKRADINAPRRSDYRDAARAAIEAMPLRQIERMIEDHLNNATSRTHLSLLQDIHTLISTELLAAALSEKP